MSSPFKKQPALETSDGIPSIDGISKAAFVDAYLAALARANGDVDTPPTAGQIARDLDPILRARGDRIPTWMYRAAASEET